MPQQGLDARHAGQRRRMGRSQAGAPADRAPRATLVDDVAQRGGELASESHPDDALVGLELRRVADHVRQPRKENHHGQL